jgi:FkbM family methyltransferase
LGTTERALLNWFSRNVKNGETWLDVGAHYGYTAIALSKLVGPPGRVFAFEPVLATAACVSLTRHLNGLPQLQVIPLGLSAAQGIETVRLATVRGMADSTISQDGWRECIIVDGFDHLWPTLCAGSCNVDGIKIDVQGMEIEVLRGMRDTLSTQSPKLVLEVHTGVSRGDLLSLLRGFGYNPIPEPVEETDGASQNGELVDNRSYAFSRA